MINLEYENNVIIKIHYDGESNTLCLLKGKQDGSIYIALISQYDGSTTILPINNIFIRPNSYFGSHNFKQIKRNTNETEAYKQLIESKEQPAPNFKILDSIHTFEVNFISGKILLEASFTQYPIGGDKEVSKEYYYLLFDLEGGFVSQGKIFNDSGWNARDESNNVRFFGSDTLLYQGKSRDQEQTLNSWNLFTGEHIEQDLLENKELIDKGYLYEYVDDYDVNQEKQLLACLFAGPTSGQDTVKVLKRISFNSYSLIFSFIDCSYIRNETLHYISINPSGDKVALLAYHKMNEQTGPNVDIIIFDLYKSDNQEKKINTGINYRKERIEDIIHYSDEVLCIVTYYDIFIYSLVNGEEIKILKKDVLLPYSIFGRKIFYLSDNKLKGYTVESGEFPDYPVEEQLKEEKPQPENTQHKIKHSTTSEERRKAYENPGLIKRYIAVALMILMLVLELSTC